MSSSGSSSPKSLSTALSTPVQAPTAYFAYAGAFTSEVLRQIPLVPGSSDKLFLLSGEGSAEPLIERALCSLDDAPSNGACWESINSEFPDGRAFQYWRFFQSQNNTLDASDKKSSSDIIAMECNQIDSTSLLPILTQATLRLTLTLSQECLSLYVLERPSFTFTPVSPKPYSLPSLSEFKELWAAWDLVTLGMIPSSMLHQKPIDLRHKPLFYIGHLPTFNSILLTKFLGIPLPEPKRFASIFERGIDPHVDDPDYCHNHSEVPEKDEDWPMLPEVLAYRDQSRDLISRTLEEVKLGKRPLTRRLSRTLMMMLEHEGFHIETILYMLIQRAGTGTLPPPGFCSPPWHELAQQWATIPKPETSTVLLGPCTIVMGHDDAESDDLLSDFQLDVIEHEFGWDNESPQRSVEVRQIRAEWRPITNGEFMEFWRASDGKVQMPASWVEDGAQIKVRTLYGPVAMEFAQHWPCLTAFDDLSAYAKAKGGRIPTEPELRLFLDKYQIGYDEGANTGFRNWHPLPATAGQEKYEGRGCNGGVWEWTSTILDTHEGFEGTTIFPGYSSDFFDGKHQVVLGASYATIPRLAERRTVRNFYQHNYPYPWVGARIVYDI
ncbi:DUF323-domain-containing protein [Abortiporus biennis]